MKESCPKNVVLMKTKNNTFLTFKDKMQFSAILCLATYDWFCADGSQMDTYFEGLLCLVRAGLENVTRHSSVSPARYTDLPAKRALTSIIL